MIKCTISVDYNIIGVNEIINIHKYLMNKYNAKQVLNLFKNAYYVIKF